MDFGYTPEQEALRREVRAFIAENVTEEVLAARGSSESNTAAGHDSGASDAMKEPYGKIYERGWLGITYPREYGGQGGDRMTQYHGSRRNSPGSTSPSAWAAAASLRECTG